MSKRWFLARKEEVSFKCVVHNKKADQWPVFTYLAFNFNGTFSSKSRKKLRSPYTDNLKIMLNSVSQKVISTDVALKLFQEQSNGSHSLWIRAWTQATSHSSFYLLQDLVDDSTCHGSAIMAVKWINLQASPATLLCLPSSLSHCLCLRTYV